LASTLDRFVYSDFAVTTRKLVYTCPTNKLDCINEINLCNTGGAAVTVDIEGKAGATYYFLKKAWSIPAGETRSHAGVLNMKETDELHISCSANTLNVWGSLVRIDE
jgi:hypothetical protein